MYLIFGVRVSKPTANIRIAVNVVNVRLLKKMIWDFH